MLHAPRCELLAHFCAQVRGWWMDIGPKWCLITVPLDQNRSWTQVGTSQEAKMKLAECTIFFRIMTFLIFQSIYIPVRPHIQILAWGQRRRTNSLLIMKMSYVWVLRWTTGELHPCWQPIIWDWIVRILGSTVLKAAPNSSRSRAAFCIEVKVHYFCCFLWKPKHVKGKWGDWH